MFVSNCDGESEGNRMTEKISTVSTYDRCRPENKPDRGIDISAYGYSFESRRPKTIRTDREQREKRKRKDFSKVLLAVLIAFVIGLTGFVLGMKLSETITAAGSEEPVSYESVLIEPGDTIEAIARRSSNESSPELRTYEKEICSVNGIEGDTIHAGNYILVPVYG